MHNVPCPTCHLPRSRAEGMGECEGCAAARESERERIVGILEAAEVGWGACLGQTSIADAIRELIEAVNAEVAK